MVSNHGGARVFLHAQVIQTSYSFLCIFDKTAIFTSTYFTSLTDGKICPHRSLLSMLGWECPSRVWRRARRILLVLPAPVALGYPDSEEGGVRACGSFLITLIATQTRPACTDREKTTGQLIGERNLSDILFFSFLLDSSHTLPDTWVVEKWLSFDVRVIQICLTSYSMVLSRPQSLSYSYLKCEFHRPAGLANGILLW